MKLYLSFILAKRASKRSLGTTFYLFTLSFIVFGLNIYFISRLSSQNPSFLSTATFPSLVFVIAFISLIVTLLGDDRQSGLLEYLVAEGFTAQEVYYGYLLAYLSISLPVIIPVDLVLGLMERNVLYILIVVLASVGTLFLTYSISFSFTGLQRVTGSSRYPLAAYVALGISLLYLFSYSIVGYKELLAFLLYLSTGLTVSGISLLLVVGKLIDEEKLLP
ncbi:hypothetical protein [Sulfolobus acidocaldarius]|uniref:Membrane protein n=4 Tax=Sulfolobus acidocaldarius TaxID=2285 RepID=Q4JAR8_SULAC|nr:hypothetical protein [Sulfolobus acidocaldarius]AAY80111.1 membrane protein [Sulfolobus acidocaldarius DSM 639]AGE70685.1 membrane protein [Sulfolobus acidocaldarius N8]AGE72957.1 membrane protein [Sulfolobus acidocaldarius Ron12/I]ALU28975.1 hypothetical protein ATY89_02745 [Sulfolobus acidocaldarius]ALU31702.1 hypothetical protein ATZ20_05770 [Sulfolobus acidocaldarius]